MTDDPLHRFATKVVELREKNQTRVDEALMKEVANDLGMSDEELAAARDESRAQKQRAQTMRAAGNLDAAIDALESAWAFNPLDVEGMYLLADALFTRSQKTKNEAEWQRAKEMCVGVLEVAPAHAQAPSLMNAINNADPAKVSTGMSPAAVIALVVGAVVLLAALAMFLG